MFEHIKGAPIQGPDDDAPPAYSPPTQGPPSYDLRPQIQSEDLYGYYNTPSSTNSDASRNAGPSELSSQGKNIHTDNNHSDSTYSNPTSSSPSSKLRSSWRKLKQENEDRRSKYQTVTTDQAAQISGHDERGFALTPEAQAERRKLEKKERIARANNCDWGGTQ